MKMTLRNMRIFLAVADCGSMSEAAKHLCIAQPSVSGTIAEIEEQYGIRLFERLGRRLYITATGKRLEEYARQILSSFDAMELDLRNADETTSLRLGATLTVGSCLMTDLVERFLQQNPPAMPRVFVYNTARIEQMLLRSELDAAVVEGKVESKDLRMRVVMQDPLVLLTSPRHNPFEKKTTIYRQDLAEIPFVMREQGSGTRALFEQKMEEIPICEQWTCNNNAAVLDAAERGFGCAVISRRLAMPRILRGALVEVPVADMTFERSYSLVWHKNKYISDSLQLFLDLCDDLCSEIQ